MSDAKASPHGYKPIIDALDDAACIVERVSPRGRGDYRFLAVNAAMETMFGVAGLTGRTMRQSFPGESESWYDDYDRVLESGQRRKFERSSSPQGKVLEMAISRLEPDRGQLLMVMRDVTGLRAAEAAMRTSEERFRAMVTTGGASVYLMSPDWSLMYQLDSTTEPIENWQENYILEDDRPMVFTAIAAAIRTGTMFELEHRIRLADGSVGWVLSRAVPIMDADGEVVEWFGAGTDITARRQVEERQIFLLKLSDALRPLSDVTAIEGRAVSMLAEAIGANRVFYASIDADEDTGHIEADYFEGLHSGVGSYSLSQFAPHWVVEWRAGRTTASHDVMSDGRFSESEKAAYATLGTRGALGVPLVKDGKLVAVLGINHASPHSYGAHEIAIIEAVAERTWATIERARAEALLSASEARFRQFADASSDALWIRNAQTFEFEYVSPALATIFGVQPEEAQADARLINSLIVPEERDAVSARVARISAGERIVQDYRIHRRTDQAFRWIRSTGFPLHDERGRVNRIAAIVSDITDAKLATEHQDVLLAELQHRVRNIMAIIRSMARRSADSARSIDDYRKVLEGRLLALSRVQVLLTRQANAGGSLRDIIESEVGAQAHLDDQFELSGPEVMLSPKAVEVLTLALHELATNAVKYGAFAGPGGHLSVRWEVFDLNGAPWLRLDWVETGGAVREPVVRRGFGSELVEARIPYELGGSGRLSIDASGARCQLQFPLARGDSILETGAPVSNVVHGGSLDSAGAPDLSGRQILVVENEYYMAADTAAALRGAGAQVLGPCPSAEAARQLLETATPDAAVVDLNLRGDGPSFDIPHLLRQRGVPMIFVTGYDPHIIPEDFANVARLQKPVPLRQVVEAVSRLG